MDAGDGRDGSILHPNATSERVLESLPKNESDETVKFNGYVTDNPDLWFYQLVHLFSVIALIVFGLIKGLSCAIQFLKGSKRWGNLESLLIKE